MFAQGTMGTQSMALCEGLQVTDWVVDLDGVMWRGRQPIEGSAEAVATLLERGDRVLFCTNNSMESGSARGERLRAQGIPAGAEVVTSADAVCSLVRPGERVLVVGGSGLLAALSEHGALPVAALDPEPGPFDAVVVGLSREFDFQQLDAASAAVRGGARLLATNDDATFPGADGTHPGAGSLVAAVETASETTASVAGKPYAGMCDLIVERLELGEAGSASDRRGEVVVIGDRPGTDGRLAVNLGVRFALVLSGVTAEADLPVEVPVALVAPDLAAMVAEMP